MMAEPMREDTGQRILDRLDEARLWRGRMEQQMSILSHQVAELDTEMRVRAEHAEQCHADTAARLRDTESALRGGGAVDVNISQGNQTVGAEPAATATKSALPKTAAAAGGSGFLTWLFAGDGWQTISAALKKWLG